MVVVGVRAGGLARPIGAEDGREGDGVDAGLSVAGGRADGERGGVRSLRVVVERRPGDAREGRRLGDGQTRVARGGGVDLGGGGFGGRGRGVADAVADRVAVAVAGAGGDGGVGAADERDGSPVAEGVAGAVGEGCVGALDDPAGGVEACAGVAAVVDGEIDRSGRVPGAAREVDRLAGGSGGVGGDGERVAGGEPGAVGGGDGGGAELRWRPSSSCSRRATSTGWWWRFRRWSRPSRSSRRRRGRRRGRRRTGRRWRWR